MCRNITTLRGLEPPATEAEIEAAARQYVRKVTGVTTAAGMARPEFVAAVDAVAQATRTVMEALPPDASPDLGAPVAAALGGSAKPMTAPSSSTPRVWKASSRQGRGPHHHRLPLRAGNGDVDSVAVEQNPMPRGTSPCDDATSEITVSGASWPWNLSTVPTRTPVRPASSSLRRIRFT